MENVKRRRNILSTVAEQVIHAYSNGSTLAIIANFFNCSTGTVRNLLISKNVNMRAKGRQKRQITFNLEGE